MSTVTTAPKLSVTLQADFDPTVRRFRQILAAAGFSIAVDTSVQDIVGPRSDIPLRPHWIFGVYLPDLVYRAFVIAPESCQLLLHNFTVAEVAEHLVEVSALDPRVKYNVLACPYLKTIAEELYANANRVLEAAIQ